jgi:transcriptional regulator with XRE-family HTH domain
MRKNVVIKNRLRSTREFRGQSQAEIARLTGVHYSSISRFEGGLAEPSPEQREKIAAVLSVPADFIFPPEEKPKEAAHV